MQERPSVYEFAGGHEAFVALAAALHDRCAIVSATFNEQVRAVVGHG